MPTIKLDFCKKEDSSHLNGIFLHNSLRGMLVGNEFRDLNLFFQILFADVHKWEGFSEDAALRKIHIQYKDIVSAVMSDI